MCEDVLPQIGRTGRYGPADTMAALSDPATLRTLLLDFSSRSLQLEATVAAQQPKVEAQSEAEGLRTDRRKGSCNNIVEWSPRLRAAWDAALAHRRGGIARRGQPEQLRPENRFVFLSEDGEPLTKDGLDSAWRRPILKAIEAGVITEEQRFSLHDLKRKGVTDTKGTKRDKQDAAGLTEPMMNVYDLSVPLVKPADAT